MNDKLILLVEGNPDDEALTLRALQHNNIRSRVVVVRDGAAALAYLLGEAAQGQPEPPALVLLDVKLPKIDGLEVLRRLRIDDRTKTIPVIVLATSPEEQEHINRHEVPHQSCIRKPVEFPEFFSATQQLGLRWPDVKHVPPTDRPA
jgi:two-component system, response regulator